MDNEPKTLEEAYQLIIEKDIKRQGVKTVNREDISNFIFKITDGGREQFSIYTIRKNDSRTDPSKKAGMPMTITGHYGACKAGIAAAKEKKPKLSTKVQYKKNLILRMCVSSVDGKDYVSILPPEKRTRSYDVSEISKIEAGGETYDII